MARMDKLRLLVVLLAASLPGFGAVNLTNASSKTQYVSCGTASGLDNIWTSGGVTVWIRARITGVHASELQARFWSSRDSAGGFDFYTDNTAADDKIKFAIDAASADAFLYTEATWPDDSVWRSGAVAWDGATMIATSVFWSLNGSTGSQLATANGSGAIQSDAGNDRRVGLTSNGFHPLNGDVAGVVVCGTQLTQAKLNQMTLETTTRRAMAYCPAADVLVALEFLDGAEGQTEADQALVQDLSPAKNNCSLADGVWRAKITN